MHFDNYFTDIYKTCKRIIEVTQYIAHYLDIFTTSYAYCAVYKQKTEILGNQMRFGIYKLWLTHLTNWT